MGRTSDRGRTPLLRTAAALTVVLALSGCSGSRDAQAPGAAAGFTAALTAANSEGTARAREIARLTESAEGQGLERTLEIYDAIADEAAAGRDRYAGLPVPPQVAPEMAEVLRLLTDQVETLDSLAPVARSGDRQRTAEVVRRLAQIGTDLVAARQRLTAALARCGDDCD